MSTRLQAELTGGGLQTCHISADVAAVVVELKHKLFLFSLNMRNAFLSCSKLIEMH